MILTWPCYVKPRQDFVTKNYRSGPPSQRPPQGGSPMLQGYKQGSRTRQVGLSIFGFDIRGRTPEARHLASPGPGPTSDPGPPAKGPNKAHKGPNSPARARTGPRWTQGPNKTPTALRSQQGLC